MHAIYDPKYESTAMRSDGSVNLKTRMRSEKKHVERSSRLYSARQASSMYFYDPD